MNENRDIGGLAGGVESGFGSLAITGDRGAAAATGSLGTTGGVGVGGLNTV